MEEKLGFKTHPRGFYIVFEGIDGCGKSSQLSRANIWYLAYVSKKDNPIVLTKEPDKNGKWGKKIYTDLFDQGATSIHARYPFGFQDLYARDFAENMEGLTIPALINSKIVLKDRSHVVSCVYGSRDMVDVDRHIQRVAVIVGDDNFIWPDIIFIFDIAPDLALDRLRRSGKKIDDFEGRIDYLGEVRERYKLYAQTYPNCFLIDGSKTPEEVFIEVRGRFHKDLIRKRLPKEHKTV